MYICDSEIHNTYICSYMCMYKHSLVYITWCKCSLVGLIALLIVQISKSKIIITWNYIHSFSYLRHVLLNITEKCDPVWENSAYMYTKVDNCKFNDFYKHSASMKFLVIVHLTIGNPTQLILQNLCSLHRRWDNWSDAKRCI